jgi:hypothetical protein
MLVGVCCNACIATCLRVLGCSGRVCACAFVFFETSVVRVLGMYIRGCMSACTWCKWAKQLACVFSLFLCLLYGAVSFFVLMRFSQVASLQSTGTS